MPPPTAGVSAPLVVLVIAPAGQRPGLWLRHLAAGSRL